MSRPRRVLFVCTHNSARSIMAEVLLRHYGGDAYDVHSAGIDSSEVRPLTLRVLSDAGLPSDGLASRSVDDYVGQRFDDIITVCDEAEAACPTFPGEGRRLHWSFEDPAAATGTDEERLTVFRHVFRAITDRIGDFIAAGQREA